MPQPTTSLTTTASIRPNRTSALMTDRPASSRRTELLRLARFAGIGVASTAAYAVLYLLFRHLMGAFVANALALLLTAVANTAANRRLTFGIRGRANATAHQLRGLIAFATGLALTTGALMALHAASPHAGKTAELTVLVVANLLATMSRFVLYRGWVFAEKPDDQQAERLRSNPARMTTPGGNA